MIHHSTENRSNSLGPYEVLLVPVPGATFPTRICAWRSTDFSLYETHPDCVFISIENSKNNAGTYTPGWDLEDGRAIRCALHTNWPDILDFILAHEQASLQFETSEHVTSSILRTTADEFLHSFRQRRFNAFYGLPQNGDIVVAQNGHPLKSSQLVFVFQKISEQKHTPLESCYEQDIIVLPSTPQQNGNGTYLLSPRSVPFLSKSGHSAHKIAHLLSLQSQIENARKNGANLTTLQDIFKNGTNSFA